MDTRLLIVAACVCTILVACSPQGSVFALKPAIKERSQNNETSIAECIASRWNPSTRKFTRTRHNNVIRLRAKTFFKGIAIGVQLSRVSGETLVEYFERRVAAPVYRSMVHECLAPMSGDSP